MKKIRSECQHLTKGINTTLCPSLSARELEERLEKRRATQRYIEEFKQKQEEVI